MYTLSAKIRIGKVRKIKNLVLSKVYYTSSVIPIVITIDSYKGYKLGYKFIEWLFVQIVYTNNYKLLLRKGKTYMQRKVHSWMRMQNFTKQTR